MKHAERELHSIELPFVPKQLAESSLATRKQSLVGTRNLASTFSSSSESGVQTRAKTMRKELFALVAATCVPAVQGDKSEPEGECEDTNPPADCGVEYDSEDDEHPLFIRLASDPVQAEDGSGQNNVQE